MNSWDSPSAQTHKAHCRGSERLRDYETVWAWETLESLSIKKTARRYDQISITKTTYYLFLSCVYLSVSV